MTALLVAAPAVVVVACLALFVVGLRSLRADRVPAFIDGKLGYYSMDAGVPITAGTWDAAQSGSDVALTGAGYRRIGFDHYAKPENSLARAAADGRIYRTFQGYSDEPSPVILATGASAISFVDGLYAQNEKNVGAYVARVRRGESPVVRGLERTRRESVVASAIGDLLCGMSADVGGVLKIAAPAEASRLCAALDRFEADGVITWQGDRIRLADDAFLLARTVAAALDPYSAAPASGLSPPV